MHPKLTPYIDRIRSAAGRGECLAIQGAGSKAFYGNVMHADDVLDTRALSGIIRYEPSELYLTAWAGTPLNEIETLLAAQGQCLAFEPPHFGAEATVGGVVAAGLSGATRPVVGGVRDFVLGLQMVNGKAELLQFGGQVMKNVAGYDVSRALCGSMGQLGLITQVSLKVLPLPPAQATLALQGLRASDALALLHRWGQQPLPLYASAWYQGAWGHHAPESQDSVLRVRLGGAKAAVAAALLVLEADAQQKGARVWPVAPKQAEQDWQAHAQHGNSAFAPPAHDPEACLWRLSVAPTTPAATQPPLEPFCIEWQGGLRWVWARADQAPVLRAWAAHHGGHASLFRSSVQHGENDKRMRLTSGAVVGAFAPLSPLQAQLQEQLRQSFDPHQVFHTGRLLPRTAPLVGAH